MSLLSHQSAVNSDKNFWLQAEPGISTASQFVQTGGGSVMDYNADILFATNPGLSTARILGVGGALFIQTPNQSIIFSQFGDGVPRTQINPDSTETNFLAGIYCSTIINTDNGLQTNGYGVNALSMTQLNASQTPLSKYNWYLPSNDGSYLSSIGFLNYASKDNFSYNAITSPILQINPYDSPAPSVRIPTYTLSTATANIDNAIVSTVNGTQIPANATLIQIGQPQPTSPQTLPQQVTTIASINPVTQLVPGGVYSYDIGVVVVSAVANNAGSAPTYPFNIQFGVRLGGNGLFDYGYTVSIPSAGGLGVGGVEFNLSGITTAGTNSQAVEIVQFHAQTGTTVTMTFGAPNDSQMYLQRVG